MNYNFQALFTHLNQTGAQALLQDLWRKVDEYEKVIEKMRQENDEILTKNRTLSTQNDQQNLKITDYERLINGIRQENEENLSKNRSLSTENHENYLKILSMDRKINDLTNEIEVLRKFAAGETPTCPCCLENFDTEDHQAYLLSCPHVICSKCLYPALKKLKNPSSFSINNSHIIRSRRHPSKICPVCGTPVHTKLKKVCLRS